jgi:hypothetical protein
MIKGIGPIYAKNLVKAIREQVFDVIEQTPDRLQGGRRHRAPLPDTELAQATCGTIRLKLLKLGARVTVSVRRIKIAIASACPTRPNLLSPMPGCARRPAELHSRRLPPAPTETCALGDSPKSQPSPQHYRYGKPPLRRQHHYCKIISHHPIPPAKPLSHGRRALPNRRLALA